MCCNEAEYLRNAMHIRHPTTFGGANASSSCRPTDHFCCFHTALLQVVATVSSQRRGSKTSNRFPTDFSVGRLFQPGGWHTSADALIVRSQRVPSATRTQHRSEGPSLDPRLTQSAADVLHIQLTTILSAPQELERAWQQPPASREVSGIPVAHLGSASFAVNIVAVPSVGPARSRDPSSLS